MLDWADWSTCDVECGRGQRTRSREISQAAAGGGKACEDSLAETEECVAGDATCGLDVDCVWGDWDDWGACAKCGGQKIRKRHITQQAEGNGKSCEPKRAAETAECPRRCHSPTYCVWGDWGAWESCSRPCGQAVKGRTRWLESTHEMPADAPNESVAQVRQLQQKFAMLQAQEKEFMEGRMQELCACFAGGLVSFLVFLGATRVAVRHSPHEAIQQFSRSAMSALTSSRDSRSLQGTSSRSWSRASRSRTSACQGPGGHEYFAVASDDYEHFD